jgi:2-polyprenyl-3-methyl-5-hydroxy-6-metoxy-1,4-benzoquinol methylase
MSETSLPGKIRASAGSDSEMLICPSCSSGNWEPAQRVRRASLSQCTNCGLLATTSFLKNHGNMEELYDVTPQNHEEYRKYYLASRLTFYKRILPKLDRFLKTTRLLEVGSGYGHFLEMVSQAGWEAEGVEISNYACEVARSRGCKVHQKDLLSVPLVSESYDVIAMWDVIEHLTNVGEIVERCAALLRPGGAFIARTPDGRALRYSKGLLKAAYRHLAYPANTAEHVFHFTPETLSLLMARKGFPEVEIDAKGAWEERPVPGRNRVVRFGRHFVLHHAYVNEWPYEFVITSLKG